MLKEWPKVLIALYGAMSVVTFGHAAAGACSNPLYPCVAGDRAMAGLISAPLWPLYWSWEYFDEGAA